MVQFIMRHPGRTNVAVTVLFVVVLAWEAIGCSMSAVESDAPPEAFTAHLDRSVPQLMDRYDVPGATLALVRRGEVVWTGAYGYADRERQRPMTVDEVFRAESISKPVTAWGVMRLVEMGRIDLDAPIERYLGDFTFPGADDGGRPITVRYLLSNSAGLPLGPVGPEVEYAPGEAMPSVRDYVSQAPRPVQEPGARFIYSNVGFNTLELLVEEVTGRDFAAYMTEEVLRPIGMDRARFGWADSIGAAMPLGYEMDGTPVPPYVYPVVASGGLLASVMDVARFVAAEIRTPDADAPPDTTVQSVLLPESVRQMHRPEIQVGGLFGFVADAYGFGHFIETLPSGHRAVWHGGQGHGWMTHFHAVPATGDGIVILTNSERSWPLMARVLNDWSQWCGVGSIQFGRIEDATRALWAVIGALALASFWMAVRLFRGYWHGRRRWAPLARTSRLVRGLQIVVAVGLIGVLAWSLAQPYLFVTSIFPIAAPWVGIMLLLIAVIVSFSAMCPRRDA